MLRLIFTPFPVDPSGMGTAFSTNIAAATPTVVGVFGAVIGLVFLIAVGYFIIGRVRGAL